MVARAHQFLTFATAPNLQAAVAFGLDTGDDWIPPMRERFQRARDRMTEGLRRAGFAVLDATSTYFLCVDLAASGIAVDDETFATMAVERAGVAVRQGVVFPHRSQTKACSRLRAPGDRNTPSSARSICPLVYTAVPHVSTVCLTRHGAHMNLPR